MAGNPRLCPTCGWTVYAPLSGALPACGCRACRPVAPGGLGRFLVPIVSGMTVVPDLADVLSRERRAKLDADLWASHRARRWAWIADRMLAPGLPAPLPEPTDLSALLAILAGMG